MVVKAINCVRSAADGQWSLLRAQLDRRTILHNIADDTHIIKVAPSTFSANILGHGYLSGHEHPLHN